LSHDNRAIRESHRIAFSESTSNQMFALFFEAATDANGRKPERFKRGMEMEELRLTLDMIAEELGDRTACKFADYFGGTRFRIPNVPQKANTLTDALSVDAVRMLSKRFGGGAIDVPTSSQYRRVQIARLRGEGMSTVAIARQVACTQRYVCDVLAEQHYLATHRG